MGLFSNAGVDDWTAEEEEAFNAVNDQQYRTRASTAVKAVITYHYKSYGVCGATIGADGGGDYAIIVHAPNLQLLEAEVRNICNSQLTGLRHSNIVCVIGEDHYSGPPITEIFVTAPPER